jgi:TolB-like protein
VLFAAGLASYAYLTPGSTPQPPPQELPVVTVLPFANANDDPEQQYFIDGLTEDLTTDLSRVSGLRMISSASSFAFKDSKATPREIAQELGAGFVVSGSVRRDNRRLMAACFSSAGSQ